MSVAVVKEVMPWLRQIQTSALTVLRATIVHPEMQKNGFAQLAFTVRRNQHCLYLAQPASTTPPTESQPLQIVKTALKAIIVLWELVCPFNAPRDIPAEPPHQTGLLLDVPREHTVEMI